MLIEDLLARAQAVDKPNGCPRPSRRGPHTSIVIRRIGGGRRDAVRMLVIDAANVIGSRPTGWWRDRPGAARRFTERVRATVTAGRLDPPVTRVLDGRARARADGRRG